jgi:hypothetical protein
VQVLEVFPRTQKAFTYDFGDDVSGYTFTADYQSILLDTVTYDRVTGDPNLADTTVAGYFDNAANVNAGTYINTTDAATGGIVLTIPQNRYTGNILPNARTDVVATVVSFQWTTDDSPPQQDMHRWVLFERWDPTVGANPGSPRENTGSQPAFVAL